MTRQYNLGKWQVASLTKIARHEVCCTLSLISQIRGSAAKWDRKYKQRLLNAIHAHNQGIAKNSPVDPKFEISEDNGGFKLTLRKHLI